MSAISIPKGPFELKAFMYTPSSAAPPPQPQPQPQPESQPQPQLLLPQLPPQTPPQTLIIVPPASGIKEQLSGTYARKLAQNGFTTITYDAAYQGESGGEPRLLEDPESRVSDVWAVVDYIEKMAGNEPTRIGVIGVCAGGGYAVAAAKADYRLQAVAAMSMVNLGDSARLGWHGDENPVKHVESLRQAAAQMSRESRGAEPAAAPYVPPHPNEHTPADLRDGSDYYSRRAIHPRSPNKMLFRSFPRVLNFDAFHFADLFLKQPILLIAGENAGTVWHTERLDRLIGGAERKRIVPGATHTSFYDDEVFVDLAVEEISEFMRIRLI